MMIRAIKLPRRRLAAMGAVAVFVCALVLVTTALGAALPLPPGRSSPPRVSAPPRTAWPIWRTTAGW